MTSTTTRIITICLTTLAIAAPAASAMPLYEHGSSSDPRGSAEIRTGSLAGTTSTQTQDLRNPDQVAPLPPQVVAPQQDLRNPDNRAPGVEALPSIDRIPVQQSPYTPEQLKPVHSAPAAPATVDSDNPSPFVFIIPAVVLIALIGAGIAFTRTSRPVRRSAA